MSMETVLQNIRNEVITYIFHTQYTKEYIDMNTITKVIGFNEFWNIFIVLVVEIQYKD